MTSPTFMRRRFCQTLVGCAVWIALAAAAQFSLSAEENVAVGAVNQFGLACQRQTLGNALISPWSMEQSLGMAYAGSAGETRAAMGRTLGYSGDGMKLLAAFRALGEEVRKAKGIDAQTNGLQSANRLFVSERLALKEGWQKLTSGSFFAEAQAVDFSQSEPAEKIINEWVKAETGGKIPAVIPAGALHPDAKLVLVNALSFEMPWEERFTKELTREQPFYVAPAKSKTVPLMFKQHQLRYARRKGFQIAALPYAAGAFQFVVILPDAVDGLPAVEAQLTPQLLTECATLPLAEVRLSFPRIKMEPPAVAMKPMLTRLGMGIAFGGEANFRGISEADLAIGEVFQRAFIEMDEDGTKAAAATATMLIPKNGHPSEVPHETVTTNHPFIFLVQDCRNGACLFIGRVVDPAPAQPPDTSAPPAKK